MGLSRNYKGVVWTDHALDRLRDRGIDQSDAWYAFRRPDQSRYAKSQGAWIYYKDIQNERIEVVAKKEGSKWVIISVWSRPSKEKKQEHRQTLLQKLTKFFRS